VNIKWNKVFNFWSVNLLGWSIYSLVNIPAFIITQRMSFKYFAAAQASTITGFFITAFFRFLFKKYKIISLSKFNIALIIIVISLFFSIVWYIIDSFTSYWIHSRDIIFKEETFLQALYHIIWGSFIFISWSTLYITINLWRKWEEEKLKVEQANLLAINSQLDALRYQLNPHFLFNSLSSLRAVINKDKELASKMVGRLSEFLQYTLRTNNHSLVPLKNEIENVKAYLEIEKVRFGDNLVVNYYIDQLSEEYPVPPFILNPLVENSVKYGYDSSEDSLIINIKAEIRDNKSLTIEIENSGNWVERNNKKSLGLENIQKRLALAYNNNYNLSIEKLKRSVKVKITLKKEL